MNIVSMGMKYLAPVVITKIAGMLGIRGPVATKLIMAAVPTIMAMFAGKAKSGGAGGLLDLIKGQPDSSPDSFAKSLETGAPADMAGQGSGMLRDFLGGSPMDQLTNSLANYGGVSAQESMSLAGMAAPAVLGALKTQVQEQGLDADGLAALLSDQAQNIGDAVPADYAAQVKGLGLLDAVPGAATPAPAEAAPAPKSGGLMKFILPLVILAGLAWYFLSGQTDKATDMMESQSFEVDGVDIGGQFNTAIDGLKTTVGGITDTASAEAAVPALNDFNTSLDGISGLADKLPDAQKTAFGGIVGTALGAIRPMIENAIEASGAGGILQPIADTMFEKMESMGG